MRKKQIPIKTHKYVIYNHAILFNRLQIVEFSVILRYNTFFPRSIFAALTVMKNDSIYKRIAQLTPEKKRLLEKKLKEQGRIPPAVEMIPRRKDPRGAPLSFSQRRMWYLQQVSRSLMLAWLVWTVFRAEAYFHFFNQATPFIQTLPGEHSQGASGS